MGLVLPQKTTKQITKQLQQKLRQHINDIAIQAHWEKSEITDEATPTW